MLEINRMRLTQRITKKKKKIPTYQEIDFLTNLEYARPRLKDLKNAK